MLIFQYIYIISYICINNDLIYRLLNHYPIKF